MKVAIESIQSEAKRSGKKEQSLSVVWENINWFSNQILKGKNRGMGKNIWRNNGQISPSLIKIIDPQIQGSSVNSKEGKHTQRVLSHAANGWKSVIKKTTKQPEEKRHFKYR